MTQQELTSSPKFNGEKLRSCSRYTLMLTLGATSLLLIFKMGFSEGLLMGIHLGIKLSMKFTLTNSVISQRINLALLFLTILNMDTQSEKM